MNTPRSITLAVSVCAALAFAACGPDDSGDGNNGGFHASNNGTTYDSGGNNGGYDSGGNNGGYDAGGYADTTGAADAAEPPDEEEGTQSGENYEGWVENDFIETSTEDTSTFSIDVDNGSYTIMRSDVQNGRLPVPEGVRVEEYVNFFDFDYDQPADGEPFSINLEVAPSKFGHQDTQLVHIGLQGREVSLQDMKPSNLVFLVDVSGSMDSDDKIGWVKTSLHKLVDNLRPEDRVAIVTYASEEDVALASTPGDQKQAIRDVIDGLSAGGSTNGEAGIDMAYAEAEVGKLEGGNNRVILMTDGDFNVGRTGQDLIDFVESKRDKHITLTTVGYGRGNYNDASMEAFARKANGNYFYVDKLEEAQRIFGDNLPSTIEVIAADVKVQVEFDATTVKRYRLVGYENRLLDNEDFDDDTKDAGEIGPGHTVTALYEVEMQPEAPGQNFLSTVRLRYKDQFGDDSKLIELGIKTAQAAATFADASADFRFSAAVTEYAEILRGSKHSEDERFDDVISVAQNSAPTDDVDKQEFISLVQTAKTLWEAQ